MKIIKYVVLETLTSKIENLHTNDIYPSMCRTKLQQTNITICNKIKNNRK